MKIFFFFILALTIQVRAQTIIIGAEDDWAPYSSVGAGGKQPKGLTPRIVKAAFKSQKVEVEFRILPFARCLDEVLHGQSIGCFDAMENSENKGKYIFNKTPLFTAEVAIWGEATSLKKKMKFQDLRGEIVGVTNSYTYPPEFSDDKKIEQKTYQTDYKQLEAIANGRLKYGIIYKWPGFQILADYPEFKNKVKILGIGSRDPFHLAFSKTHPDGAKFADIFEKGMKAITADGTYRKIIKDFEKAIIP